MSDGKTRAVADHNFIRAIIEVMERKVGEIGGDMVRCTAVEKPVSGGRRRGDDSGVGLRRGSRWAKGGGGGRMVG